MDLYASVRQDVARALKIRPKSPDALRTLAEALRRCVRTTNALKASAGVLRDCLRANPDDGGCRRQLRRDQSLLTLINDAASAEREGDYDAAMAAVLESATLDRDFQDGLARKAMLLCFAVVGEDDERLDGYRRQLATLLY